MLFAIKATLAASLRAGMAVARNSLKRVSMMTVQGNRNVLIVGNQPAAAAYWAKHLAIAGFTSAVVHTGAGALFKIAEHAPDVILLDVGLSDMDGLDVIRFVRGEPKTWRTPMLTVSALPHMKDRCLQAGSDVFLLKPLRILELIVQMKKLLDTPVFDK